MAVGGTTGQVLAKVSATDFDTHWVNQSGGDVAALEAEIAAARGDRTALDLRIGTISNFASPNAGAVVVGSYYDNAFHALNTVTLVGAANRVEMVPFYTSQRMRIDEIGVSLTVAAAGAFGRCFIYGSDATGWPYDLLFEGASDLEFDTTGFKAHSLDFTFDSGRQYWLGFRNSGSGTIRALNLGSSVNLGLNAATGNNYLNVIRNSIAFADPLPAIWSFVETERFVSGSVPSIRMRAAAV